MTSAAVHAIGTALPPNVLEQPVARDLLAAQPGLSRLGVRRLRAAFDASSIDTRHTVLDELVDPADGSPFVGPDGLLVHPSTGVRNARYVRHVPELVLQAARRALAGAPELTAGDVTHVITASCTGFFAPGPDHVLVRELGLSPATERMHLGFMGCYAAFPALRAARTICTADPDAVVLVVCVELCTLHVHSGDDLDTVVASSVFADGAAAALVTARPPAPGRTVLGLDGFASAVVDDGREEMAWTIGDLGFDMVLTAAVPKVLEREVARALEPLRADDPALAGRPWREVDGWAVHPGGRSVLDRVQVALGLDEEQLAPSREVLRRHGNMSSATVLFILADLLADPDGPGRVCAVAFGPGLTVESALLSRVGP
ncbi:type III polyketide synthase [Auraticoccus monumenti]|uniref:Predicted naringenin-chalcone synthase n=1 Tax=Auraticoccus monumenti TaxID=675864 RepID=A0A1G7B444_9ACTN|nr:type III polyketide synthase [Auraticoccus monumenti]SDE21732.1 Predicted naringenin-chalcone synthase [Auraticoccus monumenti]